MTASAPASSMTLRVRTSAMALRSLQSLGGLGAGGVEDLHAGERGGVHAALGVDLDAVREPRGGDREQPLCDQVAAVAHVVGEDMVRPRRVEAAGLLVRPAV